MLFRKVRLAEKGWYHSFELPDGRTIAGMQSLEQLKIRLAQFDLPDDLSGARVLDVGAWDGWFTFELERRGAQVTAVDSIDCEGFRTIHRLLGSRAEYRQCSVYDLDPKELGTFDVVLFLGVLYHLRHPILGLERVCAMADDLALIESYVTNDDADASPPHLEFYEGVELRGQFDNWFGPNVQALMALCRTAGFATTALKSVLQQRAHVQCGRRWPAEIQAPGAEEAPHLLAVADAESMEEVVHPEKSSHVSFYFKGPQERLERDAVRPTVGGFGVYPALVEPMGNGGWMAVGRLPPGLDEGEAEAVVQIEGGEPSAPRRLEIRSGDSDFTVQTTAVQPCAELRLVSITDGRTWVKGEVDLPPGILSLWVLGLPEDARSADLNLRVGPTPVDITFVGRQDDAGHAQVNAILPVDVQPGDCELELSCQGATVRGAVTIRFPD